MLWGDCQEEHHSCQAMDGLVFPVWQKWRCCIPENPGFLRASHSRSNGLYRYNRSTYLHPRQSQRPLHWQRWPVLLLSQCRRVCSWLRNAPDAIRLKKRKISTYVQASWEANAASAPSEQTYDISVQFRLGGMLMAMLKAVSSICVNTMLKTKKGLQAIERSSGKGIQITLSNISARERIRRASDGDLVFYGWK